MVFVWSQTDCAMEAVELTLSATMSAVNNTIVNTDMQYISLSIVFSPVTDN